jgi:hypothetical protein
VRLAFGNSSDEADVKRETYQNKEMKINTEKGQFNARIGEEYKRMIKVDAAKLDLTNDEITEAIIAKFHHFYPLRMARKKVYREHIEMKKLRHGSDAIIKT